MKRESGNWILDSVAWILTYIQTEETFKIISLVLTCIATGLSILFTIWKWWKKAYKDKHISLEELEKLEEELKGKEEKLQKDIKGEKNDEIQ